MSRLEKLRANLSDCDGIYITSKANIFYYSGFTSEDASLLITPTENILITDSRYIIQAGKEASDFRIFNVADGLSKLFDELAIERMAYEEDNLTVSQFERIKELNPKSEFIKKGGEISFPRSIKEPAELEKLRNAERLGDMAFSHILKYLRVGISEREIAYELENFMRRNGATKTSFDTIVASGIRSAMPHGVASEKLIGVGDFVTMDFGCVLDGYCSDMTRTVVMKKAEPWQREIYDVVLKAQLSAIESIKEGALCSDIDMVARKIIDDAGYGKYFTHSLGHSVGIEIHESPNFSPKSNALVSVGNVITVEPGIYIDGVGGVRIEDVIAITTKNVENLTKISKELIII